MKKIQLLFILITILFFGNVAISNETNNSNINQIENNEVDNTSINTQILSFSDKELYSKIFILQKDGKWKSADKLIKKVKNKILMGQVYYQRYMHPTKYRSKYKELYNWLKKYNDHPGSHQLYKLAKRRKPVNGKKPTRPANQIVPANLIITKLKSLDENDDVVTKPRQSSTANSIMRKINKSVQNGNVTIAFNYLNEHRKRLTRQSHAEALGYIARGYYRYHKLEKTIAIAEEAYEMDKNFSWEANWWAGLDAYRSNKFITAGKFFERMSKSLSKKDKWLYSASYFWAGKSYMKANNMDKAKSNWRHATFYPTTFYGLLASQSLGEKPKIAFATTPINKATFETLLTINGFKRAVALIEINQHQLADRELRYIKSQLNIDLQYALMQAGHKLNTPNIQYVIGNELTNKHIYISQGYLYPDIPYKPQNDWELDRALILGFIRQESQYRSYVKSHAGAVGLMQLIPLTARFIARKTNIKPNSFHGTKRYLLYRPELSMTLGQSYIKYLLEEHGYNNNLFLAISSYNAGPGNISKWRKKVIYNNDPLLFIESLPSRETRLFMEKVVSNFWIYRLKYNGKAPSLKQVADGQWPIYERLD